MSEGTAREYLFDIQPPQVAGIEDVSGAGSLPAGRSLAAQWLIAPAPQGRCAEAATLRYQRRADVCGERRDSSRRSCIPCPITVLPNPQLAVKYFLERDVSGDDPLTDPIEPAAPFSLGMMVTNHGCGAAGDVQVVSVAAEDRRGWSGVARIDFKIIGTRVGRDAIPPVLNARLGDIRPEANTVVHWLMQSSLRGWFDDYKAGFMYADALGDKRLAMVG